MKKLLIITAMSAVLTSPAMALSHTFCANVEQLAYNISALKQNGLSRETTKTVVINGRNIKPQTMQVLNRILDIAYRQPKANSGLEEISQRNKVASQAYDMCIDIK